MDKLQKLKEKIISNIEVCEIQRESWDLGQVGSLMLISKLNTLKDVLQYIEKLEITPD